MPTPLVSSYTWESAFREETNGTKGVKGFGGVAVVFKSALISLTSVVRQDTHARFLWIRLQCPSPTRDLFITVYYFPLRKNFA